MHLYTQLRKIQNFQKKVKNLSEVEVIKNPRQGSENLCQVTESKKASKVALYGIPIANKEELKFCD